MFDPLMKMDLGPLLRVVGEAIYALRKRLVGTAEQDASDSQTVTKIIQEIEKNEGKPLKDLSDTVADKYIARLGELALQRARDDWGVQEESGKAALEKLRSSKPSPYQSVFISYSSHDNEFARRLHRELLKRGVLTWFDEHDIPVGESFVDTVGKAIETHDRVALCCSQASLSSKRLMKEIKSALNKEQRAGVLVLLPLALDRYALHERQDPLTKTLRERSVADFSRWRDDWDRFAVPEIEKLVKALRVREK